MNQSYDAVVNTRTDLGQLWRWGYATLRSLNRNYLNGRISLERYVSEDRKLRTALLRRSDEITEMMLRGRLGNPTQVGGRPHS